jgi:hypothetical protein
MYIDANQDGNPEIVNFNFNWSRVYSGLYYNEWIVLQFDFSDGKLYLASPYDIFADFNSGFQEWYLPTGFNYITAGITFDYEVYSYDWYGVEDYAGMGSYDYTKLPIGLDLTDFAPDNSPFTLGFWVDNLEGYHLSKPQGVMLVDYYGQPGIGQAYYWPVSALYHHFFPMIIR